MKRDSIMTPVHIATVDMYTAKKWNNLIRIVGALGIVETNVH